jgi:hypothetical protein
VRFYIKKYRTGFIHSRGKLDFESEDKGCQNYAAAEDLLLKKTSKHHVNTAAPKALLGTQA